MRARDRFIVAGDATTVRPSDAYLAPGNAMRDFGYGYLLYLLPGKSRQFAFVGDLLSITKLSDELIVTPAKAGAQFALRLIGSRPSPGRR